jgi:hypothetical protein
MIIIILAIVGLAGIIVGIVSLFWAKSLSKSEREPKKWKRIRIIALLLGILIGVGSWPGTYFMGYPYKGEKATETGRVVGLPMMVAYFDSEGRDYVGPFTMPAVVGNSIFWFFLPHIILVMREKIRKRNAQQINRGDSE